MKEKDPKDEHEGSKNPQPSKPPVEPQDADEPPKPDGVPEGPGKGGG